jgi:hypothetical protein
MLTPEGSKRSLPLPKLKGCISLRSFMYCCPISHAPAGELKSFVRNPSFAKIEMNHLVSSYYGESLHFFHEVVRQLNEKAFCDFGEIGKV